MQKDFKDITMDDIKNWKQEGWKPKFLGIKKEEIDTIEYCFKYIEWFNKNWRKIYVENIFWRWKRTDYKDCNKIYEINQNKEWEKWEYDVDWDLIYNEDSTWRWEKWEYNVDWDLIYYGNSNWKWQKWEYDKGWKKIYYEDNRWFKWRYIEWVIIYYCKGRYYLDWKILHLN